MKHRNLLKGILWISAALALLMAAPALAGGWAVVSLDSLPQDVTAGEPFEIGFMVRQHGISPFEVDAIEVLAEPAGGGRAQAFEALPDGPAGHYTASLVLEEAGAWEWGIASGLYPEVQAMPDLEVLPAAAAQSGAAVSAPAVMGSRLPRLIAGLAVLAAGAALAWVFRSQVRRRPAPWALGGVAVLMLGLAFIFGSSFATAAAPAASLEGAPLGGAREEAAAAAKKASAEAEMVAVGEDLMVAKGCVVCHMDQNIRAQTGIFTEGVPSLSGYRNDPVFLRSWLKDPKAIRNDAKMPNLELKEGEIEALIAYLNRER